MAEVALSADFELAAGSEVVVGADFELASGSEVVVGADFELGDGIGFVLGHHLPPLAVHIALHTTIHESELL